MLRFAIVGSGPSGCYAASALLRTFPSSKIDVIDALPTPFGLIRYGVAPDHLHAKNVTNQFSNLFDKNASVLRWYGNIRVGHDVLLSELQRIYSAVILATGASSERTLNSTSGNGGSHIKGILNARDFVAWYNGHPFYTKERLGIDLKRVESVGIIGNGNVAIDVARILVKDTNELIKSDISNAALDELKSSGIQNVHVFGRRGPAQATWTSKELRELLYKIPNVDVMIDENDMKLSRMDEEELELEEKRVNKKCFQLLYDKYIESKTNAGLNCDKKSIAFHFKVTPIESILNEPQNMLKQVVFARNILKGEMGQQKSEMINPIQELRVNLGLCFSSIGSDVDLDGLLNKTVENFEALEMDFLTRGLKNYKGRLFSYENGTKCFFDPSSKWNAVYAAGWLKRGAHGIIGTNKWCAEETIESIKQDVSDGIVQSKNGSGSALIDILKMREVQWIDWNGWKRIDEFEVRQGRRVGRPRQKVLHISEMLTIAGQPSL